MSEYINLRGKKIVFPRDEWDKIGREFESYAETGVFITSVHHKIPSPHYTKYQILKLLSLPGEKCLIRSVKSVYEVTLELRKRDYVQIETNGRCSITPRGAEFLRDVDNFLEKYGDLFKLESHKYNS